MSVDLHSTIQGVLFAERRLSVVGKVESTVEVDLVRPVRLRQSVLRSAFEGRLEDGCRSEDWNVGRFVRSGERAGAVRVVEVHYPCRRGT